MALNIATNELDKFDNSTYHFRLFAGSQGGKITLPPTPGTPGSIGKTKFAHEIPDNVGFGDYSSTPVLLAESGATRVSIDDVEITILPVTSSKNKTGVATNIEFTISEANSATFLDDMYNACIALGVGSFVKAAYYLELTFKGRTVDESEPYHHPDRWIWPIAIRTLDSSIDKNGAIYSIQAIEYNNYSYDSYAGYLQSPWKNDKSNRKDGKKGFKSAEQVFKALASHLNYTSNSNNRYAIWVHQDLIDKMKYAGEGDARISLINNVFSYTTTELGEQDHQFDKDTSVHSIIDNIMSLTSIIKDQEKDPKPHYDFYKVITKSCPIDSDHSMDMEFKTFSKEKETESFNEQFKTDVAMNPDTNDYSKCIVYYVVPYVQSSVLKNPIEADSKAALKAISNTIVKRYDYLFTGLNDQVHGFDINFKFNFYTQFEKGGNKNSNETSNYKIDGYQFGSYTSDGMGGDGGGNKQYFNPDNSSPTTNFLSPLKEKTQDDKSFKLTGDHDGNRSYFNSVLSTAKTKGNALGDLINMELSIKGDPYWLGHRHDNNAVYNQMVLQDRTPGATTHPNYSGSQPAIIFQALPPAEYDEDTGLVGSAARRSSVNNNEGNSLINGVCFVRQVENSFSQGIFKQNIVCYRATHIGGNDVSDLINKSKGN